MKLNWLALLLLFLMLGLAAAQQNNSLLAVTNTTPIEEWRIKAEKGEARFQLNLGSAYEWGNGWLATIRIFQ